MIIHKEVLVGCLLGNASIEKKPGGCGRLRFAQALVSKEYIEHLYEIFKNFVLTPPCVVVNTKYVKEHGPKYKCIAFSTLSFAIYSYFSDMFYTSDGGKQIPKSIEDLLTERGLAYWFMDHGSRDGSRGYRLSTRCTVFEDMEFLLKVLENKFGLACSLHKTGNLVYYKIYIKAQSVKKFNDLISNYVLPCFTHKLIKK